MPINTDYYELTENGIKNKTNSNGKMIGYVKIGKGQTVKFGLVLLSKPSTSTSFTLINKATGKSINSSVNFGNFQTYALNTKYERTFTAEEDIEVSYGLFGNADSEIFEFQLWAEYNELTDYTKHEEESYVLYIQKEMLQKDDFVKEADGWKEVHGIIKIVIDGVNTKVRNLKLIANNTMIQFAVDSEKALNKNGIAVSNCFKQSKNWSVINTVVISDLGTLYFHCKSDVISEITNDAMNALLQQMYEQGNPLICYATATNSEKLTCTKEQSAVLEELNNLDLFEEVNNIMTAEDIALLKLKYALDVETYVDNKIDEKLANINQQILNIAGGN